MAVVKALKTCPEDRKLSKRPSSICYFGQTGVRMDDGKEEVFGSGDVGSIPPGHDGWTIGNQPVVWLEIQH